MNCKVVVAMCVAACIQMLHAADADEKFLREHAIECIDSLNVFSAPQYAVQRMIKPVLDKDSLSLELDSVRVAEVDTLLQHWVDKCGDIFNPDVYTPKFLKATPLEEYVKEVAARQQKERSDAMGNDSLSQLQKEIENRSSRYTFIFSGGYLHELLVQPFKGHHVQYNVNGTNLFWNGNGVVHTMHFMNGGFWGKDSLIVRSGYKTVEYKIVGGGRTGKREEIIKPIKMSVPRKDLAGFSESNLTNGSFTNKDYVYTPMPVGSISKNWSIKLSGKVGLNSTHYTDAIIDDMEWYKDSSMYVGGFAGFGGHFDVNLGVVHCSPVSERCYGFGAGYGHLIWAGKSEEEDWYGRTSYGETVKSVKGVNVYGEYFFQSENPIGLRETMKIPLDMDMKYLESRTAVFYDGYAGFELGLVWSPALYIPGLYVSITTSFTIGPLF